MNEKACAQLASLYEVSMLPASCIMHDGIVSTTL